MELNSNVDYKMDIYCQLIDRLFPVLAVHHGHVFNNNIIFDEKEIEDVLLKAKKKLEYGTSPFYNTLLIRAFKQREMEQLCLRELHTKPQRWIDSSLSFISANWRTPKYYFERFYLPDNIEMAANSLRKVDEYLSAAIFKTGVLDCFDTISRIKYEMMSIKKVYDSMDIIPKSFYKEIEIFSNKFINKMMLTKAISPFWIPLGKSNFEKYLLLETGVQMESDTVINDLVYLLKYIKNWEYIPDKSSIKQITPQTLYSNLNKIFKLFSINSEEKNRLLNNLRYANNENILCYNVPLNFVYVADMCINTEKDDSFVFLNRNIKLTENNILLKIAHEIYPGHLYTDLLRRNFRKINRIIGNKVIDEGWAKYSEFLVSLKSDSIDVRSAFINKLKFIAELAYASMFVHTSGKNVKQCIDNVINVLNVSENQAKNLIIQVYKNPFESIDYILGLGIVVALIKTELSIDYSKLILDINYLYQNIMDFNAVYSYEQVSIRRIKKIIDVLKESN
ncbi:hypothetical protein NIE88_21195 [Sporolactobacillus shoreicorticis]|uniref:Uncharacterized protein n=1 Tax=Sporolactobacillus shoreicorticis TaxID=1923877 RepID=A0ABW5S8R2_9BACL|nr:hypothetical protein [Sporolactobacillus shoreicorticis]MCO7128249.1 hypothetical protein [Sporolactobacillus shoreicorticis]